MSLVVNMQQRRTVASGRQNQDPNTPVTPGREKTTPSKQQRPKVERSIQEVLNHKSNPTGRGRQMVLAALQKKQAEKESSPVLKITTPRKNSGSARRTGEGARAAAVPVELKNNKLSISDNRKRAHEDDASRAPLTTLNGSITTPTKTDNSVFDWTEETTITPPKPSPATSKVYKSKKSETTPQKKVEPSPQKKARSEPSPQCTRRERKTEATPPTPPLKSPPRRKTEFKAVSPVRPPVFEFPSKAEEAEPSKAEEITTPEPVAEVQPATRRQLLPTTNEPSEPSFLTKEDREELEKTVATLKDVDAEELETEAEKYSAFVPRRLYGLMNLGNTCYMNVIVQILCNLPTFVNAMERFFGPLVMEDLLEGHESVVAPDIERIYAALLKVFRDMKRAERFETVNPGVLKHAFAKHQSSFWGCIQQDAHEFFCSLIDQVQEDVSLELNKQLSFEAQPPKLESVCPTTQNFSCSVRNNLTCAGCGSVSSVEETYRDFSLALPEDERTDESQNCSLGSLLNHYFQETKMSRKCEKCGVEDTNSKTQIQKLPQVLVLQLKRLHMDRDIPCTKVSAPVKFTSRLDIEPWCAQDKQLFWSNSERIGTPSTSYRLHGVVNHLGFNAFGGHFIADIFDAEANRWFRCDDTVVNDVAEETVLASVKEAYMFFYVHESVASKN